MGNDTDADGDTLTAILITNVTHGSLTLNADGSFVYTPNANYNGTDTFVYRAIDGFDQSADTTVTITIDPVNDAPVLDNSGTMAPNAIAEDDSANPGTLVSDIIASAGGDRITDVDSSAVEGIAVISADTSNGSWEYSINGGSNWNALGSVSATNGRLLASDSQIAHSVPAERGFQRHD